MPQNIVIINYSFPPNDGIGGRRWAKIAKQLTVNGHHVFSISREPEQSNNSPWTADVAKIDKLFLPIKYPRVLTGIVNNVFDKVYYRFALIFVKLFSLGNYFDPTVYWDKQLTALLVKLNKRNSINVIIVTGAPFHLIYIAAKFKKLFPQIKLVCDYRDPWIGAANYGMKFISQKRKKIEIEKQNFVLENSDFITAPNALMLEQIKMEYCGDKVIKSTFLELQHSFDPDDYHKLNLKLDSDFHFTYAGSLYQGCEKYLIFFRSFLNYLDASKIPYKVNFYTPEIHHQSLFNGMNKVSFNGTIGKAIFEKLEISSHILVFLAEHNKDFCTSKFFEFLPLGKPYLYLGPLGKAAEFIKNEHLGLIMSEYDNESFLNRLQNFGLNQQSLVKYQLSAVVEKFEKQLK